MFACCFSWTEDDLNAITAAIIFGVLLVVCCCCLSCFCGIIDYSIRFIIFIANVTAQNERINNEQLRLRQ